METLTNEEIGDLLLTIGEYLALEKNPFKSRAYKKAGEVVKELGGNIGALYAREGISGLLNVPGVGSSIAEKIEEIITTGRSSYYDELKKNASIDISSLSRIEGLGPQKAKKLHEALGIQTVEDLEKAAKENRIAGVPGFGEKTQENILRGITFLKQLGPRIPLSRIMPLVRSIETRLVAIHGVTLVVPAGSLRRRRETIGDIDFLVVARDAGLVMESVVGMPGVSRVSAHGESKTSVKLDSGIDVDVRVVDEKSSGAALLYFTGSKDHNIALRSLAIQKGYSLNEYGLWKGKKSVAGETEEEVYRVLGLSFIPPEIREGIGEIDRARLGTLPSLIGYEDLRGDLQVQTSWTDGNASIEEMALAAISRGLEYIAITDHTKRLAMTHGLSDETIRKQWVEIDRVNKRMNGRIKILKGTECDILRDGSLDLSDETLSHLDIVGVSVHSHFRLSREEQTRRIVRAIENPHVDILFHPTGRIIGRREAYDVDMDRIIKVAKETHTVLEIDAYPDRLDLNADNARKAKEGGVRFSIDSDAHAPVHFEVLEYGIAQARRGWVEREDVINSYPVEKMLQLLK